MTARTIGAVACALAFAGCGGYEEYVYEEEAGLPAVEVTPALPAATQKPDAEEEEEAKSQAEAVAFLKDLPQNPLGQPDDGLVRSKAWAGLKWSSANPVEVTPWKWAKQSDDVLLLVKLKGRGHDKAAISRLVDLALAETGTLRLDIYNATDREMSVAFGVFASADRVYSESEPSALRPGWNRVVFDLSASTFKSAASEWKHATKIWKREDVREIALLFYDKTDAAVVIDSVEIDAKPSQVAEPEAD